MFCLGFSRLYTMSQVMGLLSFILSTVAPSKGSVALLISEPRRVPAEGWSGMWMESVLSLGPDMARAALGAPAAVRARWCLLGVRSRACILTLFCLVFPQGMVLSAEYIKKKLEQEMVLSQAFGRDLVSISFLLSLQANKR